MVLCVIVDWMGIFVFVSWDLMVFIVKIVSGMLYKMFYWLLLEKILVF